MSEETDVAAPSRSMEILEWIMMVGSAVLSAVGAVWAVVRTTHRALENSITKVDRRVDVLTQTQTEQQTQMAVMQAHADNYRKRLEEIKDVVQDVDENVRQLSGHVIELRRKS